MAILKKEKKILMRCMCTCFLNGNCKSKVDIEKEVVSSEHNIIGSLAAQSMVVII